MPTIFEKKVLALTDAQKLQLIRDHEQLEKDAMIGDCLLRSLASEMKAQFDYSGNIIIWMERLAFEAYRHFARRYIERYERRMELTGGNPCSEITLSEGMECVLFPPEEESKP